MRVARRLEFFGGHAIKDELLNHVELGGRLQRLACASRSCSGSCSPKVHALDRGRQRRPTGSCSPHDSLSAFVAIGNRIAKLSNVDGVDGQPAFENDSPRRARDIWATAVSIVIASPGWRRRPEPRLREVLGNAWSPLMTSSQGGSTAPTTFRGFALKGVVQLVQLCANIAAKHVDPSVVRRGAQSCPVRAWHGNAIPNNLHLATVSRPERQLLAFYFDKPVCLAEIEQDRRQPIIHNGGEI